MKKIFDFFFSMLFMAFLILVMILSTAAATFIENDFGLAAARMAVYNARWFEILLLLILINLLGNMIRRKVYKTKKLSIFLFHFAFLFIFIGAGVTRYISYEGTMHIREKDSSNHIISSESYLKVTINDNSNQVNFVKEAHFIPGMKNRFNQKITVGDEKLELKLLRFIPNAEKSLTPDQNGEPMVSFITLGSNGRQSHLLKTNQKEKISDFYIGFNDDETHFNIVSKKTGLFFICKGDVLLRDMVSRNQTKLEAGKLHPFKPGRLYITENMQLVLADYLENGKIEWEIGHNDGVERPDAIILEATCKSNTDTITCFGKPNQVGKQYDYKLEGATLSLTYGPKSIQLPFSLYLDDFQLERYPGSNSPASYVSEVKLIDREKGLEKAYSIFMNNILKYRGYRFFQSSYDTDEKGTILSVSHDSTGTAITYVGYFIMALGMLLSIFNKNSRFRILARAGNKKRGKVAPATVILVLAVILLSHSSLSAQSVQEVPKNTMSASQAAAFSSILVQDQGGRIKPIHTLVSDIVRKVSGKETISGLNSVQVILGMYFFPEKWRDVPMIKVSNEEIRRILGVDSKYASYSDFFDMSRTRGYKLTNYVQTTYQKRPGGRNQFDKSIMKVDERVNICYMVYSGSLLRIFPAKNDPDQKWYGPEGASQMTSSIDSLFVSTALPLYRNALFNKESSTGVSDIFNGIKKFQKLNAGELYLPKSKITLEILYNKVNIFDKLTKYYGIIGFILLLFLLTEVLRGSKGIDKFIDIATILLILGFSLHTIGLGVRWYVSGHAPWSNGYESMIYIAWAAMLTGLIFVKKSPFTLVAASLLAALALLVAHMSWMSPEITNLVPVLKSYWLTIHVSVITASYGFLGTGMVLGLFNLFLYVMKTEKNHVKLQKQIELLSRINEMALILGVYFITTGTFLGAVWANESWGRYWGWDPKETWALITVLVYVFITHMRFVPGLKGHFAFNIGSIVGFFSVLMTYFGVNYYLTGLHSYAGGEPVPVPKFVYITIFSLILLILFAWFNERNLQKKKKFI